MFGEISMTLGRSDVAGAAVAAWYLPLVIGVSHFAMGLSAAVLRVPFWAWFGFVAFWAGKEFFGDMTAAGFSAAVVVDSAADLGWFFLGLFGGGIVLRAFWGDV